jgi:hypothetical protein
MSRRLLLAATVVGAVAFLAMLAVTVIWMTVPERIVYQECSPVQTTAFSVEVKQHGTSYFATQEQKKTLDRITNGTPIVWFLSRRRRGRDSGGSRRALATAECELRIRITISFTEVLHAGLV